MFIVFEWRQALCFVPGSPHVAAHSRRPQLSATPDEKGACAGEGACREQGCGSTTIPWYGVFQARTAGKKERFSPRLRALGLC